MSITINGTTGIAGIDGSAGTPAIQGTDTNTGVFYPAADTVGVSTGGSERMRVDSSGTVLVNTTATLGGDGAAMAVKALGSSSSLAFQLGNASIVGDIARFYYGATKVGSISITSGATAYNTSSDYRLKNSIAPMTGALAKVAALKPVTYKWKADGSDGEGFIAHELSEVVPQCVSGIKDAVKEDGSIDPQGIDTSFLVATLTAAIQELNAKFEEYKAAHP